MGIIKNGLLPAKVFHKRLKPKVNQFIYRVYYIVFPLSKMNELKRSIFSLNRFNIFSFYEKDHGPKNGDSLEPWIRNLLKEYKVEADGEIYLMCHPRVFGYVFNPVSFWFCYNKQKELKAVLAEVRNTFKEHHNYMLFFDDGRTITKKELLKADKVFHVSPFYKVEGHYEFKFDINDEQINININYFDESKTFLTSVNGKRQDLTTGSLFIQFLKIPWVTVKVIVLIHYQALKIVLKGIKYNKKPENNSEETTR